jgi:hypothetical protein
VTHAAGSIVGGGNGGGKRRLRSCAGVRAPATM